MATFYVPPEGYVSYWLAIPSGCTEITEKTIIDADVSLKELDKRLEGQKVVYTKGWLPPDWKKADVVQ